MPDWCSVTVRGGVSVRLVFSDSESEGEVSARLVFSDSEGEVSASLVFSDSEGMQCERPGALCINQDNDRSL